MSIHSPSNHKEAREQTERFLIQKAQNTGYFLDRKVLDIRQSSSDEDKDHIDIFLKIEIENIKTLDLHIDVKHKELAWSDNYSISMHEYNDILQNRQKYKNHLLALTEYKYAGNQYIKTGNYLICATLTAFKYMEFKYTPDGRSFYLLPLSKIRDKVKIF